MRRLKWKELDLEGTEVVSGCHKTRSKNVAFILNNYRELRDRLRGVRGSLFFVLGNGDEFQLTLSEDKMQLTVLNRSTDESELYCFLNESEIRAGVKVGVIRDDASDLFGDEDEQ